MFCLQLLVRNYLSGFLGHWSYTSLRDSKVSEEVKNNDELSWWRKVNLGENKYKNALAAGCLIIGKSFYSEVPV